MHQLPRRDVVHLADVHTRQPVFSVWERYRHRQAHWFVECVAESVGEFCTMSDTFLLTVVHVMIDGCIFLRVCRLVGFASVDFYIMLTLSPRYWLHGRIRHWQHRE